MTLGNMHLDPAASLLFLDWENGHTLQLTGQGRIDWDPASAQKYPGALRVVEFDIAKVVQIDHASSLWWGHAYSRVNPPAHADDRPTEPTVVRPPAAVTSVHDSDPLWKGST